MPGGKNVHIAVDEVCQSNFILSRRTGKMVCMLVVKLCCRLKSSEPPQKGILEIFSRRWRCRSRDVMRSRVISSFVRLETGMASYMSYSCWTCINLIHPTSIGWVVVVYQYKFATAFYHYTCSVRSHKIACKCWKVCAITTDACLGRRYTITRTSSRPSLQIQVRRSKRIPRPLLGATNSLRLLRASR